MKRAVFFDWYNTLARSNPSNEELQIAACRSSGLSPEPRLLWRAIPSADRYFHEQNTLSAVEQRASADRDQVYFRYQTLILEGAGIKTSRDMVIGIMKKARELAGKPSFVLFDDTISTLELLKRKGLVLGLISNLPEERLSMLDELGLTPRLDFVMTSREAGADKPDPRIFQAALKKAGVETYQAIHVGDQYHFDVCGARSAGITPLLLDRRSLFPEITDCARISRLDQVVDYL